MTSGDGRAESREQGGWEFFFAANMNHCDSQDHQPVTLTDVYSVKTGATVCLSLSPQVQEVQINRFDG